MNQLFDGSIGCSNRFWSHLEKYRDKHKGSGKKSPEITFANESDSSQELKSIHDKVNTSGTTSSAVDNGKWLSEKAYHGQIKKWPLLTNQLALSIRDSISNKTLVNKIYFTLFSIKDKYNKDLLSSNVPPTAQTNKKGFKVICNAIYLTFRQYFRYF